MKETTLSLDGGALTYLTAGEGPLVVFAHALGPLAWGGADGLASLARSCAVAVPVWEGTSLSVESRLALAWFEPLVRAAGVDRAVLCAWSMAAPTAIHFAARRPACLSQLVLVDAAGLGPGLPALRWSDLPHLAFTRLLGRPTRGFVRAMWRGWVHREDLDTRPLEEATYRFFRSEPNAYTGPIDDDEEEDALIDQLSTIEVPTLVMAGRHSEVLGPRTAKMAAGLLPRGELLVFEESSHALQLEEPARFREALAEFVDAGTVPGR